MPEVNNLEDLIRLKEEAVQTLNSIRQNNTVIYVGMGTSGLAAGAGEVWDAIQQELGKQEVNAIMKQVGCIGMCVNEPLIDVQLAGSPRITYTNVTAAKIPRIISEHLAQGKVIEEWAIGFVPTEW